MVVSRRHFLVVGQSLLATAALPTTFFGATIGSTFGSSKEANLASLTKSDFQPLVNSSFAVRSGATTTAWLTLLSVEDMSAQKPTPKASGETSPKPSVTPAAKLDTFALHFQGTGESLTQGTYELEHHSLGELSLFVVPSGASTNVAVISHLVGGVTMQPPQPVKALSPKRTVSVLATSESL